MREVRDFDASLALTAALLLLAVGGSWTWMSRAGWQPWNFSEQRPFSNQIVLLTGVHFHYAGFALPILTGWTIRELTQSPGTSHVWSSRVGIVIRRFLVATVVSGVPLVGPGNYLFTVAGSDCQWTADIRNSAVGHHAGSSSTATSPGKTARVPLDLLGLPNVRNDISDDQCIGRIPGHQLD